MFSSDLSFGKFFVRVWFWFSRKLNSLAHYSFVHNLTRGHFFLVTSNKLYFLEPFARKTLGLLTLLCCNCLRRTLAALPTYEKSHVDAMREVLASPELCAILVQRWHVTFPVCFRLLNDAAADALLGLFEPFPKLSMRTVKCSRLCRVYE